MPKLHPCFHRPRLDAYDIAIAALTAAHEAEQYKYERRVEIDFLIKKLQRDKARHATNFGIEP